MQKSLPYLWPKWRQNSQNRYPIYDQNGWKTLPFGAAHTYIAHIREYPPPRVVPQHCLWFPPFYVKGHQANIHWHCWRKHRKINKLSKFESRDLSKICKVMTLQSHENITRLGIKTWPPPPHYHQHHTNGSASHRDFANWVTSSLFRYIIFSNLATNLI